VKDVNESLEFLKLEGYPVARSFIIGSVNDLNEVLKRVKLPVVMKIISSEHTHKTDVGGVITGINCVKAAVKAFNHLKRLGGVMLQEQVSGVELILGVKKDPVFNHVLLLGLGGVLVELIKDVSLRVCPVTKSEAESMIRELKTYPLLTGYRGKKGINLDLLARLLVDLSKTAIKNDIKALDINPLIANNKELLIVDARLAL